MKKTKQKPPQKNYAIPGESMAEHEFKAFIEEAEQGKFLPSADLKKDVIAAWKKKYGK